MTIPHPQTILIGEARAGIGIDIGEQHRPLIEARIATEPACLRRQREKKPKRRKNPPRQRSLFER